MIQTCTLILQGLGDSSQGFTNCILFCLLTTRVRQQLCRCVRCRRCHRLHPSSIQPVPNINHQPHTLMSQTAPVLYPACTLHQPLASYTNVIDCTHHLSSLYPTSTTSLIHKCYKLLPSSIQPVPNINHSPHTLMSQTAPILYPACTLHQPFTSYTNVIDCTHHLSILYPASTTQHQPQASYTNVIDCTRPLFSLYPTSTTGLIH